MAIIQAPPMSVTTLPMNSCSFASFIGTLLSFSVIRCSAQDTATRGTTLPGHRDLPPEIAPAEIDLLTGDATEGKKVCLRSAVARAARGSLWIAEPHVNRTMCLLRDNLQRGANSRTN